MAVLVKVHVCPLTGDQLCPFAGPGAAVTGAAGDTRLSFQNITPPAAVTEGVAAADKRLLSVTYKCVDPAGPARLAQHFIQEAAASAFVGGALIDTSDLIL